MRLQRVSKLAQERYPNLNNRQIEEALAAGFITLATGKKLKRGDKLSGVADLDTKKLDEYLSKLRTGKLVVGFRIIWEDVDIVVIDKPYGIASHPISLFDNDTVTQWAFAKYPNLASEFAQAQPTVVPHRLDIGTSGLLIVGKTRAAYELWRARFHRHEVKKTYLAWCWGNPKEPTFLNDLPIGHVAGDSRKMVVVTANTRFKPPLLEAHTRGQVVKLESDPEIFLASIECQSGVMHQVRVHLAALGYPLVGDSLYDANFQARSLKPAFHELKAVALSFENWQLSLDAGEFRQRYERIR